MLQSPHPNRTKSHIAQFRFAAFFGTVLLQCTIFHAAPARADRHCLPALDGYYDARNLLLEASGNIENKMTTVQAALDGALADARICGCIDLVRFLDGLASAAGDPGRSPAERSQTVMDASGAMERLIADCH